MFYYTERRVCNRTGDTPIFNSWTHKAKGGCGQNKLKAQQKEEAKIVKGFFEYLNFEFFNDQVPSLRILKRHPSIFFPRKFWGTTLEIRPP